jgi:hypothetical protein
VGEVDEQVAVDIGQPARVQSASQQIAELLPGVLDLVGIIGRNQIVEPVADDGGRPCRVAALGQVANAQFGHRLSFDASQNLLRHERLVAWVVLADLDPQLASDDFVDHIRKPAQLPSDHGGAGHEQPRQCDAGAVVSVSDAQHRRQHRVTIPRLGALQPARQVLEVIDHREHGFDLLPSRPLDSHSSHVRGIEVVDA